MTKTKTAILASAVAGLFATACASSNTASPSGAGTASKDAQTSAGIACNGVNSCKGQGSCHGASNSCKGQNACKGQGMTMMDSEQACKDKGGTVAAK